MTVLQICAAIYGILSIIMMCGISTILWSDIQEDFYNKPEAILGVFGSIAILGVLWPVSGGYCLYVWLSTKHKED